MNLQNYSSELKKKFVDFYLIIIKALLKTLTSWHRQAGVSEANVHNLVLTNNRIWENVDQNVISNEENVQ